MGGEFELTQPLPLKEGGGARLQDGVASIMEIKKGINCLNVAPPHQRGIGGAWRQLIPSLDVVKMEAAAQRGCVREIFFFYKKEYIYC